MNGQQTNTGAVAATGVTVGAGSPPAAGVASQGSPTGQTAASTANVGGNQQTQVGGTGAAAAGATQAIPYERFREVNARNRQLELANAQMQQRLAQLEQMAMQRGAGRGGAAASTENGGDDGICPSDLPVLNAFERRMKAALAPVYERLGRVDQFTQQQTLMAQREQGARMRAAIAEQHAIFKHPLLGRAASLDLTQKLAEYESQGIPVNPMEIAEEVAMTWGQSAQQYDANLTNGLVQGARQTAAAGANAGAAVTAGGASAPAGGAAQKPRNTEDAGKLYRQSIADRARAATGQA